MAVTKADHPARMARFSGLFRFIPPERFPELGIDPEDVPLGTVPARDHPPFLPDRFGGNAYGLGFFEYSVLRPEEIRLLDSLDLGQPGAVAAHYRAVNDIFKRLGLLIRYSAKGEPFYLIPLQYVAHFMTEVQARADQIVAFLSGLMARSLRESLKVGLVSREYELLLPELQTRLPHLDFQLMESLAELTTARGPLDALVMVGDLRDFSQGPGPHSDWRPPRTRSEQEACAYFVASRFYSLLQEGGEVLCLADRPVSGSREQMEVRFKDQEEFKRFLIFSHVYRTRRRYHSRQGMRLMVNRFDFHSFLSGAGVYHETIEGWLGGRNLAQVDTREIDRLPHQDLPLPRGSEQRVLAGWQRALAPFFQLGRSEAVLPQVLRERWSQRYRIEGEFPATLLVVEGTRKRPPVTLERVEGVLTRRHLAGCDRKLLAAYKDSFTYVCKVLDILAQIKQGTMAGIPGLELSRLRKPFERARRHQQLADIQRLMESAPRLARLEARLNPGGILGSRTPVLDNLEKLSLLGLEAGPLRQLYLIVVGHSTMTRVTFGKLPETTLKPLTEVGLHQSLEEAISTIRLYRLLSVAEAAAASESGLSERHLAELFALYDDAIRVMTDPALEWSGLLDRNIARMGGVRAKATRKMLKLFNLFEFLDNWGELERAGPRQKEAMAGFDPEMLARIQQVVELISRIRSFVGEGYSQETSSRPYFFRLLLNSELHGTGRLLPALGPAAGFTLLWICVLASERRLLNFNPLLEVDEPGELPGRLDKLRRALIRLGPKELSPAWLASLRQAMQEQGQAYVLDSGLYLTLDQQTRALIPRFLDAAEELAKLEAEVDTTLARDLDQAPARRLAVMDRRLYQVGRFLRAQGRPELGGSASPEGRGGDLARMREKHEALARRMQAWVLRQLFDLPRFASGLQRLADHCPHLMNWLLPQPLDDPRTRTRLAAARKLSALHSRRLERFQDMQRSHEAARVEFGPTAAGIVGASPLQFQALSDSLARLLRARPEWGRLLMLAVLLYEQREREPGSRSPARHSLVRAVGLDPEQQRKLEFLLERHDRFWQITGGRACLASLQDILDSRDPQLMEALFLLAVVTTAARREGLLTEDLLERFLTLQALLRRLGREDKTAELAGREELERQAARALALHRYRQLQEDHNGTVSLRHLLENAGLPEQEREEWLQQGRLRVGMDRLLKLRGLLFVDWLDVELMQEQVPRAFIYRLKGLRSLGPTNFERQLYEAVRLQRGLENLDEPSREFLLQSLASQEQPLLILGFARAAERLTNPNQVRLLLLGLAAALRLELGPVKPRVLSFIPLARVIDRKFEVVNEAITSLRCSEMLGRPSRLKRRLSSREGFTIDFDPERAVLHLGIADPVRLDRKIEAVRRARTPAKLKRLYHQELQKLQATHYHTLDFQKRLEEAFQENLARLAEEMLERVRRQMAAETSLDHLEEVFQQAWEEGLELPLSPDQQQSLRDLFDMNIERLRRHLLDELHRWLDSTRSLEELDRLWEDVKGRLQDQRRHLGRDFDLVVAGLFDRRAQELRVRRPPAG